MLKRAILALLALSLLGVFSAVAQDQSIDPAGYVPADFAGFIRLKPGDDPAEAQRRLNIATFVAASLEPQRVEIPSSGRTFDDFLPFSTLFDTDKATFADSILPWLNGDIVVAYRKFDAAFQTETEDVLLILPSRAVLEATAALSTIIQAQDLPRQEKYRNITLYIGDKSTLAITSPAVFAGPTELVKQALDIQAGVSPSLTAGSSYQAIPWSDSQDIFVSAYVTKDYILPAVNGLLNGTADSEGLVKAFGQALANIQPHTSFEAALLNGAFDGAGVSLGWNQESGKFTASASFHSTDIPPTIQSGDFNTDLLTLIPRNAMMVQSGGDLSGFLYQVVSTVPLSNFARQIYPGFPFQVAGTDNELSPAPDSKQIQAAVNGYLTALGSVNSFNVKTDLLDHLSGSYTFALMPRPNNPVPVINTPFDLLIVAEVDDTLAAGAGTSKLLQALFALQARDLAPVDNWSFTALATDAESAPIFTLASQDNLLVLGTGDSVQAALAAGRGDNRLIDQDNWKTMSEPTRPDLFVDVEMFYNTFFPSAGGGSGSDNRTRLGSYLSFPQAGIVQLDLTVALNVNQ